MARIKVICGGCGIQYTDANGNARHALKTPESGPFECDDSQAARLVIMGVAEYVDGLGWKKEADPVPQPDTQIEEAPEETQETEQETGHLDAADLEKWEYNELKALAADMGVNPKGKKKSDYIAAIVAAQVEIDDEEDPDDLPELSAVDPE